MKNKNYHTIGTIPKSNWKIVKRGKIDTCTPNTHTWPLTFLDRYRHFNKKWLRSTSFMGLSLPWCCHVCVFHMSKISDSSPNFVSDDLCFVLNQHTILDWCSATFCFWWSLFCTEPTHCFLIGVVLHFVSDDLCFVLDQHTVLDWCSATFCFWWSLFCTWPTHYFGLV